MKRCLHVSGVAILLVARGANIGLVTTATPTDCTFEEIPRSRVIVLTDMGNEADDSQTMVRLLMYANRMDIEGLIAVSSCHQYAGKNDTNPIQNNIQPTMITERIHAYGQVRANLLLHEPDWPTEEYLLRRVGHGPPGYGPTNSTRSPIWRCGAFARPARPGARRPRNAVNFSTTSKR